MGERGEMEMEESQFTEVGCILLEVVMPHSAEICSSLVGTAQHQCDVRV